MVLEPLSAFAVACNVIQIVETGCNLLAKAADYHKSTDGQTTEQRELRDVARTVNNLSSSLQSSLSDPAKSGQVSPEETRLIEANNQCLRLSKDFMNLLDQLKLKDRHTTWESFRMSLKARGYKNRIEATQNALSEARDNLNVAFLLYMHAQQTGANEEISEKLDNSTTGLEQSILTAIDSSSTAVQSEISKLAEQLKEVYLDSDEQTASGFVTNHQAVLGEISMQLRTICTSTSHERSVKEEERILTAQQRVLNSLYFGQINDRREQLRSAHAQTYQWLLKPKTHAQQSWDCFVTWMKSKDNRRLYWIHGKPGSGKSTVMKFLDENILKIDDFGEWVDKHSIVKASCFFWAPGGTLQRSFQGLYRTLLSQLLGQRPEMIAKVVPQGHWKAYQLPENSTLKEWTDSELKRMLLDFAQAVRTANTKMLLLIDGLDEFDADSQQRDDLVEFFSQLSGSENVKICVSSRPLNVFLDAFHGSPCLRLEELTRGDIRIYITSQLTNNSRWQFFQQRLPNDAESLITQIMIQAAGVFLWVKLVVTDLLRGLRDGDSLAQLRKKLSLAPSDLDDYFMGIINSIEPQHRRETSMLLQLVLFKETEFVTLHPLRVVDLSFSEEENEDFASSLTYNFKSFDPFDEQGLFFRYDSTIRRLNSRCMGLLDIVEDDTDDLEKETFRTVSKSRDHRNALSTSDYRYESNNADAGEERNHSVTATELQKLFCRNVDFLHRSLHDFLLTDKMQTLLHQHTHGPIDARTYLCSARLVQFKALVRIGGKGASAIGFASYLLCSFATQPSNPVYAAMAASMQKDMTELMQRPSTFLGSQPWYIAIPLRHWHTESSSFLTLAIDFGLTAYVLPHLTAQVIRDKTERPILDYILRPRFSDETPLDRCRRIPNIPILRAALSNGADPNELYDKLRASVWTLFLLFVCYDAPRFGSSGQPAVKQAAFYQALELMVKAGAAPVLGRSALLVYGSLELRRDAWKRWPLPTDSFERTWPDVSPIGFDQLNGSEPIYAVSDLIATFQPYFNLNLDPLIEELRSREPERAELLVVDTNGLKSEVDNESAEAPSH